MKEISGEGGGKHYFELFAYPIIDAEGAVESVVEYARDITKNEAGSDERTAAENAPNLT